MESNSLISIYGYGTSNMFLLRGIYICNRYFQIYPTISHACIEFNSRWLLPLLLIASPFWNKKKECCLLGHAKLLHMGGSFLLPPGGWQLSTGMGTALPSSRHGPQACEGTTQQKLCSATLLPIFPMSSPFMCKAGKSSKWFSYLQVLEK